MNAQLLLSAFTLDERKAILDKLETNDLRDIFPLEGAHSRGFMIDRIAHHDANCARVEIQIFHPDGPV